MPYIGTSPVEKASHLLTQGTFSTSTDTLNVPSGYTPGNIAVYVNGLRLKTSDFTASDGFTISFTEPFSSGSEYVVEEFRSFDVALNNIDGAMVTSDTGTQSVPEALNDRLTQADLDSLNQSIQTDLDSYQKKTPSLVFATQGTLTNPGAVGDGVTNDRDAIVALAEEIRNNGGGTLDGEGKTFRVYSQFDISSFSNVKVRNATFDFSDVQADATLFAGGGTISSTSTSITVDAPHGSPSVEVSDNSDFPIGSWCIVESDALFGQDGGGTVAELFIVRGDDPGYVVLGGATEYDYPIADNARVTSITPVTNIYFDRCNFIGNESYIQNAFSIEAASKVRIKDCDTKGWSGSAFEFRTCWDVIVDGVSVFGTTVDITLDTNYGVVFSTGCHWVKVSNSLFNNCKHAVTTEGTAYVNRNVKISNSESIGAKGAGFKSNRSTDHFYINGCTTNSTGFGNTDQVGILCRAARAIITNNYITGVTTANGIWWQSLSEYMGAVPRVSISGNQISGINGETAIYCQLIGKVNPFGISITDNAVFASGGDAFKNGIHIYADTVYSLALTISGNNFLSLQERGIYLQANTDKYISRGAISGNLISLSGSSLEAILMDGVSANSFEYLTFTGNTSYSGAYGIRGINSGRIAVVGNSFYSTTTSIDVGGAANVIANNYTYP